MVQNILQYKYDQIFDPENDPEDPEMKKKNVPIEKLIKSVGTDEQKVFNQLQALTLESWIISVKSIQGWWFFFT